MPIDFNIERWEKIKEDSRKWWAGELKRPLIQMVLTGRDPGRPEPSLPHYNFTAFYDFSISAEEIVDRWDYNLSCQKYLGDGFPAVWPNFGPGVIGAFLGANLIKGDSTCWFKPTEVQEIGDIKFHIDPENTWYKRVTDICRAAMARWQGQVQLAMTDLGGNLDILYTFRPGGRLLTDLIDHPDEVKQLTWDAHEKWWAYFEQINGILQPLNPGYTAWTQIFSEIPYYILQCDFCYMISPEMFDEFVKPELIASCRKLGNPFYHLDGPGQLPHLDSLLEIEELKGVQWVPGAGQPDVVEWPRVYRKIRDAGKLIQIWGGIESLETIASQVGSAEGIILIASTDIKNEKTVTELMKKYGAI
ncbi:hypothetical protein JXJ21_10550 [candidate division KSB1 bacterium]|nr:hypothetical protein [candidate division KSB1 bacterium]